MAGHNLLFQIYQDGRIKTEGFNAVRDGADLSLRVSPGIFGIRLQNR